MKKIIPNVLKFFISVIGGMSFIGLLIFMGDYFYNNFGEDYLLVPIFIFCIGIFLVIAYKYTKNSLKEEKTFSEIIKIMMENFKTNIFNLVGAIILLITIILTITYKDILLGILFAIIFGIFSAIGYLFSNLLILLLIIISITLIGIYNKLK